VPSPARESDDAERGERRAIVISHRDDDMASAQRGLGRHCYWKSVRLETQHSDISGRVAARERSVGDAPAGKRELDVLVALQDFFGGDDNSGTPMDAARGPPPSTMNSNDAAGSAFDELRSMIRECVKGAARFDHDYFLQVSICWSRYDIDANFRVLAEWLGPGLPESSDLSRASVAQWRAGNLWKFRTMAWLTCINRGGGQLDFPPTSPLTGCSHFVLLRSVQA
jgi:hypothetical protein